MKYWYFCPKLDLNYLGVQKCYFGTIRGSDSYDAEIKSHLPQLRKIYGINPPIHSFRCFSHLRIFCASAYIKKEQHCGSIANQSG